MKQLVFAAVLAVSLLFSACSSFDPFEDLSLLDPMGIVRVSSNTEIDWHAEEDGNTLGGSLLGAVANAVVSEAKDENVSNLLSRADLLVDQAEAALRVSLEEVGTVTIADKESVLTSGAYDNVDDTLKFEHTNTLRAEGYKYFSPNDEKALASRLRKEIGTKSLLYADFTFEKIMDSGVDKNGMMAVGVEMWIQMYNDEGDRIYAQGYRAQSDKTIPVVAGLYDPHDMMALFPPVIDEVCRDFASNFIR